MPDLLERLELILKNWCYDERGFRLNGGTYEFFDAEIEESWAPGGYGGDPEVTPYIECTVVASGDTIEAAVNDFYEKNCHQCCLCPEKSFDVSFSHDQRRKGGGRYLCRNCW